MAVAALILGIVALVISLTGPTGWFGSLCGILAIVFGAIAQKKEPSNKGMAKAGLVMGVLALCMGIILTIACIACAGAGILAGSL